MCRNRSPAVIHLYFSTRVTSSEQHQLFLIQLMPTVHGTGEVRWYKYPFCMLPEASLHRGENGQSFNFDHDRQVNEVKMMCENLVLSENR